jgi:hypothetical protein
MKTLRTIRNCSDLFEFRCEREWDALRPTDDPLARHCVAHSQFEADPEFRRLWLSVKQQPPSLADLPWLRLWKNG